jgi:hypothetical protein
MDASAWVRGQHGNLTRIALALKGNRRPGAPPAREADNAAGTPTTLEDCRLMSDIPVLTRRQLQAQVIAPLYREMEAQLGPEQAQRILDSAIRKAAVKEAGDLAASETDGRTSMRSFIKRFELWTAGGALEVEVLASDDVRFDFDVTRCRYAEAYREMGIAEIGHLLSCNRDAAFCEGYDPRLRLVREQTIMGGAPRCTFRYRYRDDDDDGGA